MRAMNKLTLVRVRETALLDHLVLVLDEELDALNGGGGGLGDSGRHTTHHEVAAGGGRTVRRDAQDV